MKAASTLALLAKYKVESSRSRPRVSNDNPFIESLFKTMKYRGYMGKRQYHSLEDARTKLGEFVKKYNEQWVPSSINNVTPESRFKGIEQRDPGESFQGHRSVHSSPSSASTPPDA